MKGIGDQQDYGMRIYDPRVGRFLSVDPIAAKYPELTPYQFASNTPIQDIDIDGEEGGGATARTVTMAIRPVLRVAAKDGVEQGAKVIAIHSAPAILPWLGRAIGLGVGVLIDVFTPDYEGPLAPHGPEIVHPKLDWNTKPDPKTTPVPAPDPAPKDDDKDDDNSDTYVYRGEVIRT